MSNQHTYAVPFTEEELHHDYVTLGMTQSEIGAKYGTSQKVVWKAMHKMGIKTRSTAKRNQLGPNNSSWVGGRILFAVAKRQRGERVAWGNGYYYVLQPDHPNADAKGYVAEHIVVMTQHLGRALEKGECVHHVNLNKHDNRLKNLAQANRRDHSNWHRQLEEIAVGLLLEGLVTFDRENGYRRIS